MGKYKTIAIDQMNGICCFPECNENNINDRDDASPLIQNGKCCGYCYLNKVMPERKRRIELHSKEAEENIRLKVELDRMIDFSKNLNEVIKHLQKDLETITEDRDRLDLERDVIEQNFEIIHLNEYHKIMDEHKQMEKRYNKLVGEHAEMTREREADKYTKYG